MFIQSSGEISEVPELGDLQLPIWAEIFTIQSQMKGRPEIEVWEELSKKFILTQRNQFNIK